MFKFFRENLENYVLRIYRLGEINITKLKWHGYKK